jgi:hypothetical protein
VRLPPNGEAEGRPRNHVNWVGHAASYLLVQALYGVMQAVLAGSAVGVGDAFDEAVLRPAPSRRDLVQRVG